MESGKPGLGWGWKTVSAISSTMLIVAGAYAWNGLTATAGDTLLASKWNELVDRTEPVMAQYNLWTTQHCNNGNQSPVGCVVNFNVKEYDTHNAVTTGSAWKFTAPVAGKYRVTTTLTTAAINWGNATNSIWTGIQKNGAWVKSLDGQYVVTTISTTARTNGSATISANVGDTIAVQFIPWTTGGNGIDLTADPSNNWIAIERVGP